MIYVTHDQVEAMTMGDRICVMNNGDIMQVATPLELYNHPDNLFVAQFIGSPAMNFFGGTLSAAGGRVSFVEDNPAGTPLRLALDEALAAKSSAFAGKPVVLGVRPEAIRDSLTLASPDPGSTAEVRVDFSESMGSETLLYLDTGTNGFVARVSPTDRFDAGQKVRVTFDLAHAHIFDAATGLVLK
jgi:multiple sugar transport system ATP-binding protein